MKKVLCVVIAMLLSTLVAFAQTDSALTASGYVGAFYIGSYDKDGALKNDVTTRLGGDATFSVFERVTLNARAGYEMGISSKGIAFGKMYLERKSPLADFGVGYIPRPITLAMRPAPLSADGHFEPPALAAIPGSGTGVFLKREIMPGWPTVMLGAYYLAPSQSVEWNGSVRGKWNSLELRVAGFASRVRKGIAANVQAYSVSLTAFTTSDSVFTAILAVPTGIVDPYLNVNYSRARHDYDHLEIGWTKTYCLPYGGARMLVGMGYQHHSKLINTYVLIFL